MVARRLIGRSVAGLLLIEMAAACSHLGPELAVQVQNDGRESVALTVAPSGTTTTAGETVRVPVGTGAGWSVPLTSTWEVRLDGRRVIGAGDRADLLPSPNRRQGVRVVIRIMPDGTVDLEACLAVDYVDGRCAAR